MIPVAHISPDPHTYTIVINERQRRLLRRAMRALQNETDDAPTCEIELMEHLEVQLAGLHTNKFSTTGVNSFVV